MPANRTLAVLVLSIVPCCVFAGAANAQWTDPTRDRAEAVRIANTYGVSAGTGMWVVQQRHAEEERAATAANLRADADFFRAQPRPAAPEKLTGKQREKAEKEMAEYENIRAATNAAKAGQYQDALQTIGEVGGGDRDINILKFTARLHQRLGQYDLAAQDYDKLLNLAKDVPNTTGHSSAVAQVYIQRSRAWQSAGKFDLAEADMNEAVKKGGSYLDAYLIHVEWAELYFNEGKWPQAAEELTTVMQRFAGADRYAKRGLAYFALGDKDKAKADLDQAIAGKTKHAPGWLAHALLMASSGQPQTALDDCDYIIKTLDPKDVSAHVVKGNVYMTVLKQPAKAVEEFDAALQINPQLKEIADLREQALQSAGKK